MKEERFIEILEGDSKFPKGLKGDDNAFLGLLIIRKYLPKSGIEGAGHDVIWSVDIDEIIEAGITEEDARKLRDLNWMIEEGTYLACFV